MAQQTNSPCNASHNQDYLDQIHLSQNRLKVRNQDNKSQRNLDKQRNRIHQAYQEKREQRKRQLSEVSLSVSKNATALFSTSEIKSFNKEVETYQSIAEITQQQNDNLKAQNKYLIQKLKSMKAKEEKFKKIMEKAKYYKNQYLQSSEELQMIRQKCQAYKRKSEEMKAIALSDLYKLEEKLLPLTKTNDDSQSDNSFAFSSPVLREQEEYDNIQSCVAKSD